MNSKILFALIFFNSTYLQAQERNFNWSDSLKMDTPQEKIQFYKQVANYYLSQDIKRSEQYASKILNISQEVDYEAGIVQAHLIYGHIYFYNNPAKAYNEFVKALQIAQEIQDYELLVETLHQKALYHIRWYQYDEASQAINQEIEFIRKYHLSHEMPYETLASMYAQQGDSKKAIQYYHIYLNYRNQIDGQRSPGLLSEIGNVYYRDKNYDSARFYYLKGLEIAQKYQKEQDFGYLCDNVGLSFYRQKEYRKAIPWQQKGLFHRRKLRSNLDILVNLSNLGRSYLRLQNYDSAYLYLSEGYVRALKFQDHSYIQEVAEFLAEVFYERSHIDSAYFYQCKAHLYLDSVRQKRQEEAIKGATTKLDIAQEQFRNELLENQNYQLQVLGIVMGVSILIISIIGFLLFRQSQIRKKLVIELQEANDTKAHLFAIIAHDLRSPLSAFQGIKKQIDYFLKKGKAERLHELGEYIEKSATNINTLLDNLLNWALLQREQIAPKPSLINIENSIRHVTQGYEILAQTYDVKLYLELESDLFIETDKAILHTVLRNIVGNALKYTPKNGHILIQTSQKDSLVQINIQDTGIGMTPEKLQNLFTLKREKSKRGLRGEKGTGLGLTLAYQFIGILGGELKVESQEKKGTTFIIQLPKKFHTMK